MGILFEICACADDLKAIQNMNVDSVEEITDNEGNEGVHIKFLGKLGEQIVLSIMDGSELYRSPKTRPLHAAQDIRELIGYKIVDVYSDEDDLNSKIYRENESGKKIALDLEKALDGETIFIEEE